MAPLAFLPPWPPRLSAATRGLVAVCLARRRLLVVGLVIAALAGTGAVVYARLGQTDTQYRTVAASLGTVTQSLSLSGNLTPVGETDLGFATTGRVTAVNVQPGQQVKSGQLLATLDTAALQGALTQARASLDSAQAKLSLDQVGPTPANLAQAGAAINTAQTGLHNAEVSVVDTQSVNQQALSQAQSAVNGAQGTLSADQNQLTSDQNQLANDSGSPSKTTADQQRLASEQQRVASDQQAVNRDQSALDASQNALASAQVKATQSYDQAVAQVNSASVSLRNAQMSLAALRQITPQQLQMDRSQVQIAQVGVDNAQRSLDQATLLSPVNGTVGQVNVIAGQSVSGSGSTSTAASTGGSTAAGGSSSAPSSTGASGASNSGAGSGGTAAGGSTGAVSSTASSATSSTAAVTILSPGLFQVTGTVSDAQIGQVAIGQRARVLPAGATEAATGQVTQISPVATVTSGVATFGVTVSLDGTNPSFHGGMTAAITVILNQAVHVLTVPTGAVHTTGAGSSVDVLVNGRPQARTVGLGAGDPLRTEITSGLNEGDRVVVATVSSAVPTPGAGGGGGGIFGGGGGGPRPGGGARGGAGVSGG